MSLSGLRSGMQSRLSGLRGVLVTSHHGAPSPIPTANLVLFLDSQTAHCYTDSPPTTPCITGQNVRVEKSVLATLTNTGQSTVGNQPVTLVDGLQFNTTSAYLQLDTPVALTGDFTAYLTGYIAATGEIWCPLGRTIGTSGAIIVYNDGRFYVLPDINANALNKPFSLIGLVAFRVRRLSNEVFVSWSGLPEVDLGVMSGTMTLDCIAARPLDFQFNGSLANRFNYDILYSANNTPSGATDLAVQTYLLASTPTTSLAALPSVDATGSAFTVNFPWSVPLGTGTPTLMVDGQPATAGVFPATSSLSVASNSSLLANGKSIWMAGWMKLSATGRSLLGGKWQGGIGDGEYFIVNGIFGQQFSFYTSSTGSDATGVTATTFGDVAIGQWVFVFGYLDLVAQIQGISVNAGAANTVSNTLGIHNGTEPFEIGSSEETAANGQSISYLFFGANPVGGFATTSAASIANALYNNGHPITPSQLTPSQITAWGIVSAWIDQGNLTKDWVGTNTLTNNNGVSLASTPVLGAPTAFNNVVAAQSGGGYLTLPTTSAVDVGTNAFTANVWVKFTSSGAFTGIFGKGDGFVGPNPGWCLLFDASGTMIVSQFGSATLQSISGPTAIASNTWAMVTLVRSGTNVTMYLNGVVNGTPSTASDNALSFTNPANLIALNSRTTGDVLSGAVSQCGLWNGRALNGTEVASLYNSGNGHTYSSLGSLATGLSFWAVETDTTTDLVSGNNFTTSGSVSAANVLRGNGSQGTSWQFPITNGNPSGNPVLAGALLTTAWSPGTWTGVGGIGGQVVTNNSGILPASIDATGLFLAISFGGPVSAGTGSPTATADGVPITLGAPVITMPGPTSGSVWTYGITNGNPSGNPVLSGAVVKLNAAAGVWAGVGAVVNANVTNGSRYTNAGTSASGYLFTANTPVLRVGTSDFTVNLWCKIHTLTAYAPLVCMARTTSGLLGWAILLDGTGTFLYSEFGHSSLQSITGSVPVTADTWHMVTLTRSGQVASLYLDGSLAGSSTNADNALAMSETTAGLRLMRNRDDFSNLVGGAVSQCGLWIGNCLTGTQVAQLYAGVPFNSLGSLGTGLVFWAVDQDITTDRINGNNLTAVGTVSLSQGPAI